MRANVLRYLTYRLNRTDDEIIAHLYNHTQASRVKVHIIHDTLQFLLDEGYSTDDIFNCLNILMFPS